MKGQAAADPAVNSLQPLINDEIGGGNGATQDEATPFNSKASNSTSPLENWNLTALLNETEGTVMLFEPSVSATGFPKNAFPLAVVL